MAVEKTLIVFLRNGTQCVHHPVAESEEAWWKAISGIADALHNEPKGLLTATNPYGIHRMADVVGIDFGDAAPPPEIEEREPFGFIS